MSIDGQRTRSVEIFPKISIAWVGCTNVTNRRQTTDRRTDDIAKVNVSSRSIKSKRPCFWRRRRTMCYLMETGMDRQIAVINPSLIYASLWMLYSIGYRQETHNTPRNHYYFIDTHIIRTHNLHVPRLLYLLSGGCRISDPAKFGPSFTPDMRLVTQNQIM